MFPGEETGSGTSPKIHTWQAWKKSPIFLEEGARAPCGFPSMAVALGTASVAGQASFLEDFKVPAFETTYLERDGFDSVLSVP